MTIGKTPQVPKINIRWDDDNWDTVTDVQWKKAVAYFKNHPSESVWMKDEKDRNARSFIKIGNEIYAIAHGLYLWKLGDGKSTLREVDLVKNREGNYYALKRPQNEQEEGLHILHYEGKTVKLCTVTELIATQQKQDPKKRIWEESKGPAEGSSATLNAPSHVPNEVQDIQRYYKTELRKIMAHYDKLTIATGNLNNYKRRMVEEISDLQKEIMEETGIRFPKVKIEEIQVKESKFNLLPSFNEKIQPLPSTEKPMPTKAQMTQMKDLQAPRQVVKKGKPTQEENRKPLISFKEFKKAIKKLPKKVKRKFKRKKPS